MIIKNFTNLLTFSIHQTNKNLLIDGVEFVRYFFRLGSEERWARRMRSQQLNEKRKDEEQRAEELLVLRFVPFYLSAPPTD